MAPSDALINAFTRMTLQMDNTGLLSRGLILITRNTREVVRVEDLRLEDWESK